MCIAKRLTIASFVIIAIAAVSLAAVPTSITVQGRLTDASGVPLPPGPKTLTFQIFDMDVGGTEIWTGGPGEIQVVVSDTNGLWTAAVGSTLPIPDYVFSDSVCWLEIMVDDGINVPTTLPRMRILTGPYAYRVNTVDGATGGTITSKVSIGPGHTNTGTGAFVAGENNSVTGDFSTIGGGRNNSVTYLESTIGGGDENLASGMRSTIGGGEYNRAHGNYSVVAGGGGDNGDSNSARGYGSSIGGGGGNTAAADFANVSGGYRNTSLGWHATVGGGTDNIASGQNATVPGGSLNSAVGSYSFAAGRRAKANHSGSFVWSDDSNTDFASTASNQFLIRAFKGVGIGTDSARFQLHVQGTDTVGGYFTSNFVSGATSALRGVYVGSTADGRGVVGISSPGDYYGIGGEFLGGYVGVRGRVAPTGTNDYYGVVGHVDGGSGFNCGVYGSATGDGTKYGVYGVASGIGTNWAGYFAGNVYIAGTLVGGSTASKVDHPLDPENKYLTHSYVESPDMMTVYNGNITTDGSGTATVRLPDYFDALNKDFRYQLTVVGQFAQAIVAEKIAGNTFTIRTDKPNVEVSWQVTGIRQDAFANANRVPVEELKPAAERGLYLYPKEFGQPLSKGLQYEGVQKMREKERAASGR